MDIKHLQTLEAIITHGSYLKAAGALGYVQSTITLHIQQLEEEFGIRLFEKKGRRMALSQDGCIFREQASPLIEQMATLEQAMSELTDGWLGQVRVGSNETFFKNYMSLTFLEFCRMHPKVKLSLEFGGMLSISQRVIQNDLDIGICPLPPMESSLHFDALKIEQLTLLLPLGHPLATVETITPQDLNNVNILVTEPLCAYRIAIEKGFAKADILFRPTLEIGGVDTLIQFVQEGLGAAFLPTSAIHPVPSGTVVRIVENFQVHLTIGLLRKSRHLGNTGEKLYTFLLEHLQTGK